MPSCDHCNRHVSDRFRRAYTVNGQLHACWECSTTGHIDDVIRERCPELSEAARNKPEDGVSKA